MLPHRWFKRHSATNLSNSVAQLDHHTGLDSRRYRQVSRTSPASTLVSWYGSVVPLETVFSLPNLAGQTRAALLLPAITQHHFLHRNPYTAAKSLAVPLPAENFGIFFDWSLTRAEGQISSRQLSVPEAVARYIASGTSSFLLGTVWAS